jgi:putative tryptophan/tyrosine transport system substrate-binding protein
MIRRREFITLLGGAAAVWPLAANAQQGERLRRVSEPWQSRLTIFMQGMRKLGWIEGQNLRTEVRWSAADPTLIRAYATDLVGLFKPDFDPRSPSQPMGEKRKNGTFTSLDFHGKELP